MLPSVPNVLTTDSKLTFYGYDINVFLAYMVILKHGVDDKAQ
jgi:hypothetical protein